ncbi:MAG: preprotein translocase subunit YajC [Thermodesulfobacteriota bacterium]|nr:preprotein translocase subunit YajC [Thermodesulfobacteriota bacterium]
MFTDIAFAMGQTGGAQPAPQGGGFMGLVPLILIFVIFYFLLIRPQQKKTKEHQEMVNNLKKGDPVITNGGIHGRLTAVDDATVTVEVADRVRIKVSRQSIAGLKQAAQGGQSNDKTSNEGKNKTNGKK